MAAGSLRLLGLGALFAANCIQRAPPAEPASRGDAVVPSVRSAEPSSAPQGQGGMNGAAGGVGPKPSGAESMSSPQEGSHLRGGADATDTDKSRWTRLYQMKILAWFNARFSPPSDGAPCEELKKLRCGVVASVGPDRTITGYRITRSSGNPTFDNAVKTTMDAVVGQKLPPPLPLYPDILGSTLHPMFSGARAKCQ